MIKKFTLWALLTSGALYADTIGGGEISLGIYNHSPSGNASYTLPYIGLGTSADLENSLHWNDAQDIIFKAYLEHPVPLLPNAKIAFSNLSHDGQGTVTNFTWGAIQIPAGDFMDIDTSLDLKMYDLTLYYELLDNWVEVDAGITLRYFDGNIAVNTLATLFSLSTSIASESTDFDAFIPMLYGKTRFNIPSTDISLQLEANAISYQDTTFYDYELSARYTLAMGLGLEGGYKSIHLDSEDLTDGLVLDMDFSGFYASVVWDF
jgi:outer membrane protein